MDANILIYGAGGAGRELAFVMSLYNNQQTTWKIEGFIDDTEGLKGQSRNGIPILGGIEYLKDYSGNIAVTIFDYPGIREELVHRIKRNDKIKFPVLVSPTSIVSPDAEIGEGCIINYYNVIPPNAKLGCFVYVGSRTGIGHDATIGDFTTIYSGINIGGYVSIGSGCLIGSGVTILPKLKIGDGSIIGGGSLVPKDIPPNVVATGVPARIMRVIEE